MGNIRTKDIKKVSHQLVEQWPERFTEDFEHNKHAMKELKIEASTKMIRNKIAGYVTRLKVRHHR